MLTCQLLKYTLSKNPMVTASSNQQFKGMAVQTLNTSEAMNMEILLTEDYKQNLDLAELYPKKSWQLSVSIDSQEPRLHTKSGFNS